jgi:anaphase-promoting complex subunit 3
VLSLKARAYYELHDYPRAADIYKSIRKMDPFCLDGMDIYATCLWHLKRKVELSVLGKELEEISKNAPETLCVIGNYYSTLFEFESAIDAFKKAIQYHPLYFYAHTLLGHEYLANEDLEASSKSFHLAVQIQPRHYNAIFGLGLIEKKQEKYLLAEHYFRTALEITPENPILLDSLASVISKHDDRMSEALQIYDKVLDIAPNQKIYILHRAQLLFNMGEYEQVKEILELEVSSSTPDSGMYFLLGKTYSKLDMNQEAILAMTFAQDYMEHKSCIMIKEAIGISIFI